MFSSNNLTVRILRKCNLKLLLPNSQTICKASPTVAQEIRFYVKSDPDFKISRKNTLIKLKNLLDIKKIEAVQIVTHHPKFSQVPAYIIGENYDSCISEGIRQDLLNQYPEILAECDVSEKIEELKKLNYDINTTASLLVLSKTLLKKLVASELEYKRLKALSALFKISVQEVCKWVRHKAFLITLDLEQIIDNHKLLLEYGITTNEILRDPWVLRYSTQVITKRLNMAKTHNIDPVKTWMVRSQANIFEKYIQRRSDNKSILGDNSLAEYLSKRLECSIEIAHYIISKQPALKNKSLKKLNEMIEFLFANGFDAIQICKTPKVLLHSVDTINKRLEELKAEGMQADSLYVLTKSHKQYAQFYESLTSGKSKTKS